MTDFRVIVPILVPAVIVQVFIQAYYIRHCWANPSLSQRRKALYIALIAFFNLPAAAVYMFLHGRENNAFKSRELSRMRMDDGTRQGVFVLLVIAYEALFLNIIINEHQNENIGLVSALLAAVFMLMIIGGLFVKPRHRFLYYFLPAVKVGLAVAVDYIHSSQSSQLIVLVAVASVINDLSLSEAKLYSLCAFLAYIASCITGQLSADVVDENMLFGSVYVNGIIFILVFVAFYTMKKQMLLNSLLGEALEELREKSLRLEEMGAIAERNRIASEIHDNVGHKLTAAMISIDAGEKLLETDREESQKKLALARQQIKDGLGSIRLSVKAIKSGEEKPFSERLSELTCQITKDTGLKITAISEIETALLPIQQNVLLQAVTECATNSIKHGRAAHIDILIQEHRGAVSMTVSDDGAGVGEAPHGFGLTNMRERVQSIGGTFGTESIAREGFTVSITIPAGRSEV